MAKILLSENAQNGRAEGFGIIRSVDIKKSTAGSPYLDLLISDCNGEIRSKIWDYKKEVHGSYEVGDIVKVRGRISQYQGAEQLTVDRIRLATDEDGYDIEALIPTAPENAQQMYDYLRELAENFSDPDYRKLVLFLMEKHRLLLLRYPAAVKLHHAQRSGLLYHTCTLVRMALSVCEVYPQLDRDLLLAGTILHDFAKIRELETTQSGLASGYTVPGQLLGHLVMGSEWIAEAGKELSVSDEKIVLLQHMMISHHGEPEFGAAKQPMFPEAEVLSQLDLLDARLFNMFQELENVEAGTFTPPVWSLDHRRLYKKK